MISFEEAQRLIEKNNPPPKEAEAFILEALGCVNAKDIQSPLALPCYDNSAMDGFVLRSEDTLDATAEKPVFLNIKGTIKAGDDVTVFLGKNEAYRIMTGAGILRGGDTVVAKENATFGDNSLLKKPHRVAIPPIATLRCGLDGLASQGAGKRARRRYGNSVAQANEYATKQMRLFQQTDNFLLVNKPIPEGQHIRFKGEEIKKGELVLPRGSVINPGTIGFLATMGMKKITIYNKPRISLIATGSELVSPGAVLRPGKIYDSNTLMIQAALEDMRIRPVLLRRLNDKPMIIKKVIDFALRASDILILMGGVSVGDYDYVKDLLGQAGVKTIFWKVSQKPGKPLYFGVKKEKLVFGLPGNPASVFTCFYEYVYPAIRRFMGYKNPYLPSEKLQLKESVKPDPEKYLFIKSRIERGQSKTVLPLKHQKSHMISSLCDADSLIVVPNSEKRVEKGEDVLVHSLPYALESVYEG